jgi:tRNA (cytidine/uridine-2'-O-)-methyltransferase
MSSENFLYDKELIISLYEPEIPQNVGAIMRTCACLDTHLAIIEPCGFLFSDRGLKRSKMDYKPSVSMHSSFKDTLNTFAYRRKICLTPHTSLTLENFKFKANDFIMFGRESNGVEKEIAGEFDVLLSIPMSKRCRSLNLAMSVSLVLFKAIGDIGYSNYLNKLEL